MRKLAKLAALAVAAVMTLGLASAETKTFDTDVNTDKEAGMVVVDVTGAESVDISFDFSAEGCYGGGAVGYNTVETGAWANAHEFSNDKAPDPIHVNVEDVLADEDGNKSIQIQCWWTNPDAPFTCTYEIVKAEAPAETPDETPDEKPDDESPKTGDATSVIVLGGVALLALAGVALTKKNA